MDSEKVKKILSLADSYENQIAHYNFNNNELFELKRTEKEIENLIKPLLNNEELLLKMIKTHWSIIRFAKKDTDFFIKACIMNPECGREVRSLELLIQLHKINPSITEYAPPYYKRELKDYLENNHQNPIMESEEHSKIESSTVNEQVESHISQMSIYDYLVLCEDARPRYKLAGMITNKQFVTSIANGDLDNHTSMFEKMFQSVFSHGKYSINKMPNDIIAFYSTGEDFIINIPDKISFEQYQVLLNIVNQVKKFEEDYEIKIDLFNSDEILKEAQSKLSKSYSNESDEVIVGVPIKETESEKTKEVVQNTNDSTNYSEDNEVDNLIGQVYENINQKSEEDRLMKEVYTSVKEKEEAKQYSEMYEQALKDNEEFDRKKAEEVRQYSEMYEQALKDNKEFDRKKAEEAKQYSEMYEQALKENEEFNRRKEEEKHQSLLDKKTQLRQEWKNNMTEESYYNYKNAIKARLENEKQNESAKQSTVDDYEAKKQEYEEVSASKELVDSVTSKSSEEIDSDLDDFEAEERKILNSKHFTDDQKKQMIEQLYSEFDKYAEENPELSGRQI